MFKVLSSKSMVLGFVMGAFIGCAKEKAYETLNKSADLQFASAHQEKKLLLDMCTINDPCVYLPSVADTPYAITASRPFYQGQQKLVVSQITNDKLQFLQIEDDERFDENINNLSPVFNLSISHVDYKCSEDDFGDCTNKEEIDTDKTWSQKRFVKISDVNVIETNSLPIELGALFNSGCFSEVDKTINKLDIEKTAMNITVKKTYKAGARCAELNTIDDLRYLTFTVDYTYSIVKLSALKDAQYPVIEYPSLDESTFGFFTTQLKKKTVDNLDYVMGVRKTLMNRWSPNKKEIVYYLNSNFYTKENEIIKDATYQAIASVNNSLKKAQANFTITLAKGEDSDIGDLRQNFIILVKDPQASGVIGYGPSVANPKTGEIINARTVMYFGTIQKFVSRAYDELIDEILARENGKLAQANQTSESSGEVAQKVGDVLSSQGSSDFSNFLAQINDLGNIDRFERFNGSLSESKPPLKYEDFKRNLIARVDSFEEKIAKMAKETFYHAGHVNFDDAVIQALEGNLKEGELKRWDELSEDKRNFFMKKLIPYVWIPTLVHEFGHNLGLRHNFKGSTDKENYYSKNERSSLGLSRDVSYSSIMDYAPHTNNELMVLGKYDIAALRFGYAREVEGIDEKFVSLGTTLSSLMKPEQEGKEAPALKKYQYCSDEHVSSDPLCNRFDDGDTYEKVVNNYIKSYKKNYEKVNFRGRRYSFESAQGDTKYLNRVVRSFMGIRQFFDIFDQQAFSGFYDTEAWKKNVTLVDIKKASDASFNFFMDIIEMPSYHCIEINQETSQISRIEPFAEMAKGTKLEEFGVRFDIKFGCLLLNSYGREGMMYAEFGKYFNNSLDLTYDKSETKQGDSSQIDVRGMWMDKTIAMMLTSVRMTSPTTIGISSSGNYLDYPDYKERFYKSMNALLTNKMSKDVVVTMPTGATLLFNASYGFENNQMVNKSYSSQINSLFGLKNSQTNHKLVSMSFLKSQLSNDENEGELLGADALELYSYFDVSRVSPRVSLDRFNFDEVVEFKKSTGLVNYRFGVYKYNTKAMELAKMKRDLGRLQKMKVENIIMAMKVLNDDEITFETLEEGGENSKEEMAEIKDAVNLGLDFLNAYARGSLNEKVLLSSFLALAQN